MIMDYLLDSPPMCWRNIKGVTSNLELGTLRMLLGHKAQDAVTVHSWPNSGTYVLVVILEKIAIQVRTCRQDLTTDWDIGQNPPDSL